ncbi:MAG TPA: Crp/Fnr family transcriptional regulator [bacterium]|nr:Crp/Fnr family transcriptional regulator [bacterium]
MRRAGQPGPKGAQQDRLSAQLGSSPLFKGLTGGQVRAVAATAHHRTVEPHGVFFRQGDPAAWIFVLLAGEVKLAEVHPDGQEVIHRMIWPGEVFGGIAAWGETVYPVSAEAMQSSDALAWEGPAMMRLLERYPSVAVNALHLMIARVHELQNRVSELTTERVEQRVARTLRRLAAHVGRPIERGTLIDLPLSRQDVAEMTGTTLYTASRIISRWEALGVVEAGRERIVIVRPEQLEAITGVAAAKPEKPEAE